LIVLLDGDFGDARAAGLHQPETGRYHADD
jgi:hypothetical protein